MFSYLRLVVLCSLGFSSLAVGAEPLTLVEAERLALSLDPASKRLASMADALEDQSVADAQLPDPRFRFGLMNFPTDTFERDQEPMTQIQLGVQQMFPRGNSLVIKARRTQIMARTNDLKAEERAQQLRKQVRLKWLELHYWISAEQVINKNRKLFKQLVEVSQYHYAAGRRNQQDVIRAQLELSKLDDRLLRIQERQDKLRAELGVLIGKPAEAIVLPRQLPGLPVLSDISELETRLRQHPKMRIAMADVERSQQGVQLARESYKPGWMLGVNYGIRDGQNMDGSDRADFFSIGVTVDVPLFQDKRQDRRLAASQHRLGASKQKQDAEYLMLKQQLDMLHVQWLRLNERAQLYNKVLISQARQNTEASLFAYQNDRTDFTTLMRARISELNTELQSIRINVDQVKTQARLRYLAGEAP